jgi:4-hydroxy-2-oxoheptanedioate aldolase
LVVVPVTLADPAIVEIVGFAGAEAILIDAEHGLIGSETLRSMLAHAQSAGVPAVFRPLSFDTAVCRQALDAGAAGIHVSHVDTEAKAVAVVKACRYPPLGRREMSLGRAIDYDFSNFHSYLAQANDCQLLVVMVESLEGVANATKIAAVPGIDVIHIGIADLSHDMGLSGQYNDPKVLAAVDHVLEAAKPHNVAVGFPTADPRNIAEWAAKGIRYFEVDAPDYLLRNVYAERLAALRDALRKTSLFKQ